MACGPTLYREVGCTVIEICNEIAGNSNTK